MTTKPAIDEGMKAAFPPKTLDGAERLREDLKSQLNQIFAPDHTCRTTDFEVEDIFSLIVGHLGITPEMVEDVRPLLQPSTRTPHAMNQNAAAIALSTLLEVAGQ